MAVGSGVVRAGRAYVEIYADNSQFSRKLRETEATFRNFGSQLTQTSAQMLAAMSGVAAPIAMATKFYADFDDTMRSVYSTAGKIASVDMSGLGISNTLARSYNGLAAEANRCNNEFIKLTQTARELGATTAYTAKEAADAMLVLARAGFKIQEIHESIQHILNLARATGTGVAESTQIMIGALRSFNIEASKSERVVDLLVATANSSPQALSDIGSAMKYIGPVAKSLHLSLRDTLADLGALANFNIKGEQGGTALRNIYLRLASAKNQAKLKDTFGVEIVGMDGEFRKIIPVLKEIKENIDATGMSTAEVANAFKEIFGMRSAPAALSLMNADLERINDALGESLNIAEEQAKMMDEGVGGAIRLLISRFQELQIAMVNAFSGPAKVGMKILTSIFGFVSEFVEKNKWLIKIIAYTVGTIGTVVASFGLMALTVGIATRSVSSLMTQLRKLSTFKTSPISAIFKGLTSTNLGKVNLGTPKINVSEVDKAREATRYLNENLSSLSKTTVNIIARFNRLGKSFDLIANKAETFRKASSKFASYGTLLNSVVRPMEGYVLKATSSFNGLTKNINASRAATNKHTQSSVRLSSVFNRNASAITALQQTFYNIETAMRTFINVTVDVRNAIRTTIADVKDFNDISRKLTSGFESVARVGRSITRAFSATSQNLNSAKSSLDSFSNTMIKVSGSSNIAIWSELVVKVRDMASAFTSLSSAVSGFNRAFKQIGSISTKSIKKVLDITTMFNSMYNPKAFLTFASKQHEENVRRRVERLFTKPANDKKESKKPNIPELPDSTQKGGDTFEDINKPGFGRKLLSKAQLSERITSYFKDIAVSLNQAARGITRFFNAVTRSVDTLTNSLSLATDKMLLFQQNTNRMIQSSRTVQTEFNTLTTKIKAAVDETGRAAQRLRQFRESLKNLSIAKVVRDTERLEKGMVNLASGLNFLVQNHTAVESAIINMGAAFEKASVGAFTMAQAVRNLITNLRQVAPTVKTLEKRIKEGTLGKLVSGKGTRDRSNKGKILTAEQIDQKSEKIARLAKTPLPIIKSNIKFGTMSDIEARQKRLDKLDEEVEKKENVIKNLKMKDRATEEERRINSINERMLRADQRREELVQAQQARDTYNQQRAASKPAQTSSEIRTDLANIQAEGSLLVQDKINEAGELKKRKERRRSTLEKRQEDDKQKIDTLQAEKLLAEEKQKNSGAYTTQELIDGENRAQKALGEARNKLYSNPDYSRRELLTSGTGPESLGYKWTKLGEAAGKRNSAQQELDEFLEANKHISWDAQTVTVPEELYSERQSLEGRISSARDNYQRIFDIQTKLLPLLDDAKKRKIDWTAETKEVSPDLIKAQADAENEYTTQKSLLENVRNLLSDYGDVLKDGRKKKYNWEATPTTVPQSLYGDRAAKKTEYQGNLDTLEKVEALKKELDTLISTSKRQKVDWNATRITVPQEDYDRRDAKQAQLKTETEKLKAVEEAQQKLASFIQNTSASGINWKGTKQEVSPTLYAQRDSVAMQIETDDAQLQKVVALQTEWEQLDQKVKGQKKNWTTTPTSVSEDLYDRERKVRKRIDPLRKKLEQYAEPFVKHEQKVSETRSQIDEVDSLIKETESAIGDIDTSIAKANKRINQIRQKNLKRGHVPSVSSKTRLALQEQEFIRKGNSQTGGLDFALQDLDAKQETLFAAIGRRDSYEPSHESTTRGYGKILSELATLKEQQDAEDKAIENKINELRNNRNLSTQDRLSINTEIEDRRKRRSAIVEQIAFKEDEREKYRTGTKEFQKLQERVDIAQANVDSSETVVGQKNSVLATIAKKLRNSLLSINKIHKTSYVGFGEAAEYEEQEKLEREIKRLEAERGTKSELLTDSKGRLSGLQSQLDQLMSSTIPSVVHSHEEVLKAAEKELEQVLSEINKETAKVDANNAKVPDEADLKRKQEIEDELSKLTGSSKGIGGWITGRRKAVEGLRSELNAINRKIASAESSVEDYNSHLPTDEMKGVRKGLEDNITNLTGGQEPSGWVKAQKALVKTLTNELNQIVNDISAKEIARDKNNASIPTPKLQAARKKLEDQIRELTGGADDLDAWIDDRTATVKALKSELDSLDKTIASKESDVKKNNDSVPKEKDLKRKQEIETQLATLTGGATNFDEWVKAQVDHVASLKTQLKTVTDQLNAETKQVNAHNATVPNAEDLKLKTDLEAELDLLTGGTQDIQEYVYAKLDEINNLEKQLEEINGKINVEEENATKTNPTVPTPDLLAEKKRLEDKLASAETNVQNWIASINMVNNEIAQLDASLAPFNRKIEEKEAELETWRELAKGNNTDETQAQIKDRIDAIDQQIAALEKAKQDRVARIKTLNDEIANITNSFAPLNSLANAASSGIIGTPITTGQELVDQKDAIRANMPAFVTDFYNSVIHGGPAPIIPTVSPSLSDPVLQAMSDSERAADLQSFELEKAWRQAQGMYQGDLMSVLHDSVGSGGKKTEGLRSNLVRGILDWNIGVIQKELTRSDLEKYSMKEDELLTTLDWLKDWKGKSTYIGLGSDDTPSPLNNSSNVKSINSLIEMLKQYNKNLSSLTLLPEAISSTAEAESSGLVVPKVHDIYTDNGEVFLEGFRSKKAREVTASNSQKVNSVVEELVRAGRNKEAKQISDQWQSIVIDPLLQDGSALAYTGMGVANQQSYVDQTNQFFDMINQRYLSSPLESLHDTVDSSGNVVRGERSNIIRETLQTNLQAIQELQKTASQSDRTKQFGLDEAVSFYKDLLSQADYIDSNHKQFSDQANIDYINGITEEFMKENDGFVNRASLLPKTATTIDEADKAGLYTFQLHDRVLSDGSVQKGARSEALRNVVSGNLKTLEDYRDIMTTYGQTSIADDLNTFAEEHRYNLDNVFDFIGNGSAGTEQHFIDSLNNNYLSSQVQSVVDKAAQTLQSLEPDIQQKIDQLEKDWKDYQDNYEVEYTKLEGKAGTSRNNLLSGAPLTQEQRDRYEQEYLDAENEMSMMTVDYQSRESAYNKERERLGRIQKLSQGSRIELLSNTTPTIAEAQQAGFLPADYVLPGTNLSSAPLEHMPSVINTVEEARAAGYMDQQYISDAWTQQELEGGKDSTRAQQFRSAREELAYARNQREIEKGMILAPQAMAPVIRKGGAADELRKARSRYEAVAKRKEQLEKIASERELSLQEQIDYGRIETDLLDAQRNLEDKNLKYEKAVSKAKKALVKSFKNTTQYKEYRQAEQDLDTAKKSGDEQQIADARKTYKEKRAEYQGLVASSTGYGQLVENQITAHETYDKAKANRTEAEEYYDALKITHASKQSQIDETKKQRDSIKAEIAGLEKNNNWSPEFEKKTGTPNPMSPEDKARYDQLCKALEENTKALTSLKEEQKNIESKQEEAKKNVSVLRKQETEAEKAADSADMIMDAYGEAMPDSPQERSKNRRQRFGAQAEAAQAKREMKKNFAAITTPIKNFGKGFKTLGSFFKEMGKTMVGAGDKTKFFTARLRLATTGFKIASFAAGQFVVMTAMLKSMIEMTVVMAIVGAIMGLFSFLKDWVVDMTTKSAAQREEERREKIAERHNEIAEKANDRIVKADEQKENTKAKTERLTELSKKSNLTEAEYIESRKIAQELGLDEKSFKTRASLDENGGFKLTASVDDKALKEANDKERQVRQRALLQKAIDLAEENPRYKWNPFYTGSNKQQMYYDEVENDIRETLNQIRASGDISSPESQELLKELREIASENAMYSGTTEDENGNVVNIKAKQGWRDIVKEIDNLQTYEGGGIYNVEETKEGIEPLRKEAEALAAKAKADPQEVTDAYEAYIGRIQESLEGLRKGFNESDNKTEIKKAIGELEEELNKAQENYKEVIIKMQETISNSLPKYGSEALVSGIMDNAVQGINLIEDLKQSQIDLKNKENDRDLSAGITKINEEYKQFQTKDEINRDIDARINSIPKGLTGEDRQKLVNELEAERQQRLILPNKLGDKKMKEMQKKRDDFIEQLKNAYKDKKIADENKISNDYDKRKQGVINATGAQLREQLEQEMAQTIESSRKPFFEASQKHKDQLRHLHNTAALQAEYEYRNQTSELTLLHKTGQIKPEEYQKRLEELNRQKAIRRDYLYNNDPEFKKQKAKISNDYMKSIFRSGATPFMSSALESAYKTKESQEDKIEIWRNQQADKAVYDKQRFLNTIKSLDADKQGGKYTYGGKEYTIDELENEIKNERSAAYEATADEAKKKQELVDKEFEAATDISNFDITTGPSYLKDMQSTEKQKANARIEIEGWREAYANQAVKDDQKKLDEMIKTNPVYTQEMIDLQKSIDERRKQAYAESETEANKKLADRDREIDNNFKRNLASKSYVSSSKFNTEDYALNADAEAEQASLQAAVDKYQKEVDEGKPYTDSKKRRDSAVDAYAAASLALQTGATTYTDPETGETIDILTYMNNLQGIIDAENKFLEGHEEDLAKVEAASNKLADVKLLQALADNYYEAAKKLQEIKAQFAKKQFDYSMQYFGKESSVLSIDQEKETKITELNRDYNERIARETDAKKKKQLENDKKQYERFLERQATFKKNNILAQQNDFSRPIQKKAADITVKWQQEIMDALEANGIGLDEVDFDANGNIIGKTGRAKRLVHMGNANREAQIAAVEFDEAKANQDYELDVAKYTGGSKGMIDQMDLAISSLESYAGSGNQTLAQAANYQIGQMKYNKAALEVQQFDAQLATLQGQAENAYAIWQNAVKGNATDEEKRNAFDRYKQLVDEMQSVKTGMLSSFKDMQDSRQEISQATASTEKASTGSFKAMEASRNAGDWQRENAMRQTLLLKEIANNTGFEEII